MFTCPKMQRLIDALAHQHQFALHIGDGSSLILENPPYEPLGVANLIPHLVAVYHWYNDVLGDRVYDPEVVFFTSYPAWVPYSIQQPTVALFAGNRWLSGGGYKEVARLSEDYLHITHANLNGMRDVGIFAEQWATTLREQGWLNAVRRH